jgi:hypothetical protein
MKQFLTRIPPINPAVPLAFVTGGVHPGTQTVPEGTSSDHRESTTPTPFRLQNGPPGIPRPTRGAHDGCLESPATVADSHDTEWRSGSHRHD